MEKLSNLLGNICDFKSFFFLWDPLINRLHPIAPYTGSLQSWSITSDWEGGFHVCRENLMKHESH